MSGYIDFIFQTLNEFFQFYAVSSHFLLVYMLQLWLNLFLCVRDPDYTKHSYRKMLHKAEKRAEITA